MSKKHIQKSTSKEASVKVIHLYTWGNKCRSSKPKPSDFNLCVTGISTHKPSGINLKTTDGRDKRLQEKFERQPKFDMYMTSTLQKIIETNPKVVSINCHKGRHRSVAFCEMLAMKLKELEYTVTIEHVEL